MTGASSGIGRAIAKELAKRGYELIIVARREELLSELAREVSNSCQVQVSDLTSEDGVGALFEKHSDIDLLVNCAGCGVFGAFDKTDLDRELDMLYVNIISLHTLTKLYLKRFLEKGEGKILNVASSAAFFSGPFFSSYYASKAYVMRLSRAVAHEVRKTGVIVSCFCPGPVDTDFGKQDGISCGRGAISAEKAALRAVEGLERGKKIIFPDLKTKLLVFVSRFIPDSILLRIVEREQKKKGEN